MDYIVLKVGNSHLVAAIFQSDGVTDKLIDKLRLAYTDSWQQKFIDKLKSHPTLQAALIGSVNSIVESDIKTALETQHISHIGYVLPDELSITMQVDHKEEVGADLIANVYGALKLYPEKNCIVVDIGTAVTFCAVQMNRTFLGAAIMPGLEMGAYSLKSLTDKLPLVIVQKPEKCLGTNTKECIYSGLYFGLLGAIDRIITELKGEVFPNDQNVITLITGGVTSPSTEAYGFSPENDLAEWLQKDLTSSSARKIEPDLTLLGFAEILKEQLNRKSTV